MMLQRRRATASTIAVAESSRPGLTSGSTTEPACPYVAGRVYAPLRPPVGETGFYLGKRCGPGFR